MPIVADIIAFLERFAPLDLAEPWDNVGLLLGDVAKEAQRVMTCLTITPASAAEAVAENVDLIVSHHPILFKPVQKITDATAEGRMLLSLMKADVAVYSPHTAFDNCLGGINDILCRWLGLTSVQPLRRGPAITQYKIAVFVPETDLQGVSNALFQAGAGVIGQYCQCSFRLAGTGTSFGSDSTNPTVGEKGRREEVSEWRLEVVCPEKNLAAALRAMRQAHSYEEPAFDVYPLKSSPSSHGAGRVGVLNEPMALGQFAAGAGKVVNARHVPFVGDPQRTIRKVAVVCGSGSDFLDDAVRAEADTLVTGETRFHTQLEAEARGIGLILLGHYASERVGVEELAEILRKEWNDLTVWPSRRETDPASAA